MVIKRTDNGMGTKQKGLSLKAAIVGRSLFITIFAVLSIELCTYLSSRGILRDPLEGMFGAPFLVIVGILALVTIMTGRGMQTVFRDVNQLCQAIGSEDHDMWRRSIENSCILEFSRIGSGLQRMADTLVELQKQSAQQMETFATSSEELTASVEENKATIDEIAMSCQDVTENTENVYQEIEKVEQASIQIQQHIQSVDRKSKQLLSHAATTQESVKSGQQHADQTVQHVRLMRQRHQDTLQTMRRLNTQLNDVQEVMQLITDIARETNLLAMNAAIEAAHAGEHGLGFTVVAEEIRKLAEQSSQSTAHISEVVTLLRKDAEEVTQTIKGSGVEVNESMQAMKETHRAFETIAESMKEVANDTQTVTHSLEHMTDELSQADRSIKKVHAHAAVVTREIDNVAAAVEEQTAAMEDLAEHAIKLSERADGTRSPVLQGS